MNWLKQPFYEQPECIYVNTPDGVKPLAESMMQVLTMQALGTPNGFAWKAPWSGALTPEQLIQSFIDYAKTLTGYSYSPFTTLGFNPTARGIYYANLVIEKLRQVPATYAVSGADPNASLYDVWIASHAK